jgi:beta-glucosidase/6-phospho-beta-glucosidase/beta-galactosidase
MANETLKVPKGFYWGTATASYQIEGAWNEDRAARNAVV